MCGIAGAIGLLDAATDRAVANASAWQTHRGPDGSGSFRSHAADTGPGVAFAHRRLAIIVPTDEGRQPMADRKNGNVICFNGEIYNYRELRRELAASGSEFDTSTDTEVILRAFAQWGEDCVQHLRGMFAFALFDRATGRTLLARDRLGMKPLYYSEQPRGAGGRVVLFASEVRALLAGGLVDRRLHPGALATYAWNGFVTGPDTIVDGVRSLDAGTIMWVDDSGAVVSRKRYWRLPPAGGEPASDEELEATLAESVDQHMISDVPLGVFLSGGIDSSAIAALAVKRSRTKVRTFNVSFTEPEFDESAWARRVAETLGTEHVDIRLNQSRFRSQFDDAMSCLDQPTFDALNTYVVSRAVHEAGMTVALSGLGGDELFGGYASFADIPRMRPWSRLASFLPGPLIRALAGVVTRAKSGPHGAVPPQTRWGKLGDALASGGGTVDLYQTFYALFTEEFVRSLSRMTETSGVRRGLTMPESERLDDMTRGQPLLHAISQLELSVYAGERLLRDTDMAGMRNSLEVRVPFLDHVVVETAARLPEARRFLPIQSKRVIRDVALRGLDPTHFDRRRTGFVLPLDVWSRDGLQARVESTIADRGLCESAGVDPVVVQNLWRACRDGAPGMYWTRIWSVFALLEWVRAERVSLR